MLGKPAMTTTTPAHETISDESTTEQTVIERPRPSYGYLGRDENGVHHHLDRVTNTVYVTGAAYERFLPSNTLTYWIRVRGKVHRIIELEDPSADLQAWIDRIDSHVGWAAQPADLQVLLRSRGVTR